MKKIGIIIALVFIALNTSSVYAIKNIENLDEKVTKQNEEIFNYLSRKRSNTLTEKDLVDLDNLKKHKASKFSTSEIESLKKNLVTNREATHSITYDNGEIELFEDGTYTTQLVETVERVKTSRAAGRKFLKSTKYAKGAFGRNIAKFYIEGQFKYTGKRADLIQGTGSNYLLSTSGFHSTGDRKLGIYHTAAMSQTCKQTGFVKHDYKADKQYYKHFLGITRNGNPYYSFKKF